MKYKLKHRNYVTVLLAFCLLFVMLHFMIFSAHHTYHYCPGLDCSVCHDLQSVENIIKQLNGVISTVVPLFSFVVFYKVAKTTFSCPLLGRTLIMDKVRMDN